jgi:cytochrome P450
MKRLLGLLRRGAVSKPPLSRTVRLDDPKVSIDPCPTYEALRREGDVVYLERHGFWLVLGHEAAREVFAAPDRYSSSPYDFVDGGVMLSADPARHGPVRRAVSRAFGGEALRRAEQLAERTAAGLSQPQMEVVREFARPVSRAVAADLIGFDSQAMTALGQVEDELDASGAPDGFARACSAIDELAPHATMYIRFAEEIPGLLGTEELRHLIRLLWLASTATTARTISHAVLRLVDDPAMYRRLHEQQGLVPSFVEEVARLDPPENLLRRCATSMTNLAGSSIPEGTEVNICLPAVNRDPALFDSPSELRLGRDDRGKLSFGSGIHHCIGGPMARRVVAAAVRAFVRPPEPPRLEGTVQWTHALIAKAPRELWIKR